MLIILLLTLAILISYPVIGVKMIMAYRKKEKRRLKKLAILLTVLILLPGFFFRVLPGSDLLWAPYDHYQDRAFYQELTGLEFNDEGIFFEHDSERSFNGDGYSISIYKLDQKTANYFKSPPAAFFKKHPHLGIRTDWQIQHWKRTPIDTSEQQFLDFAHSSLPTLDFELQDLLNEKGNYYAYRYYMSTPSNRDEYVNNIDFYIICPKRKLLIDINHNI